MLLSILLEDMTSEIDKCTRLSAQFKIDLISNTPLGIMMMKSYERFGLYYSQRSGFFHDWDFKLLSFEFNKFTLK